MHTSFHNLFTHKRLLLLEEIWVTRHWQASDVKGVLPVHGQWGSKVISDILRIIRNLIFGSNRNAGGVSDDLSWTSVSILETQQMSVTSFPLPDESRSGRTYYDFSSIMLIVDLKCGLEIGHGLF